MIRKIKLVISVVLVGVLFLGGLRAMALETKKTGQMMTISPPRERMILVPGEVYEGSIDVSNSTTASRDLEYSVHIGSFNLGLDEDGNADYNYTDVDTITSYNQIMEWIKLGKESGTVAPGETDVLPYSIVVPEDAPAGGQYASIIVRNDTKKDDEGGNVMIENVVEFAVSILAEVAGETRDEGQIIDNSIPSFLLTNSLTASSTVKNTGNVHTDASYVLQVWPLFSDEEICTNEEKPSTSMIMPDTERYHSETCDDLPSIGVFKAKQTVKIFGETSIVEKTIVICPLWLLFVIIFVISLLIIGFVTRRRRNRKSKSESDDE